MENAKIVKLGDDDLVKLDSILKKRQVAGDRYAPEQATHLDA